MSMLLTDVSELEKMISDGRGIEVKKNLAQMSIKEIPSHQRARFAHVARRIGLSNLALKILNPVIKITSNIEKMEPGLRQAFGAALISLGVNKWGKRILTSLSEEEFPQGLLFRSFAHFNEWQPGAAVPLLKKFVESSQISEYERMVGHLNLLSALVGDLKSKEAHTLASDLMEQALKKKRNMIYASCHELLGQVSLQNDDLSKALQYFKKAVELLSEAHGLPVLWAKKWHAIALSIQNPQNADALRQIKSEAISLHDFETVRECDLFLGKILNDRSLILKVYYGTSFHGYRQRMSTFLHESYTPGTHEEFIYNFTETASRVIDVYEGLTDSESNLEFGRQSHQVIFHLASDLYKPFSFAQLFSYLYPDEIYDPYSSPGRVRRAIFRLNQELRKRALGLSVVTENAKMYLSGGNVSLSYSHPIEYDSFVDLHFEKIKVHFKNSEFSTQQLETFLNIEKRKAQRMIKKYLDDGLLEHFGKSSNAVYWIKSPTVRA